MSCPLCLISLENPITLPCGEVICSDCVESLLLGSDELDCPLCSETHKTDQLIVGNQPKQKDPVPEQTPVTDDNSNNHHEDIKPKTSSSSSSSDHHEMKPMELPQTIAPQEQPPAPVEQMEYKPFCEPAPQKPPRQELPQEDEKPYAPMSFELDIPNTNQHLNDQYLYSQQQPSSSYNPFKTENPYQQQQEDNFVSYIPPQVVSYDDMYDTNNPYRSIQMQPSGYPQQPSAAGYPPQQPQAAGYPPQSSVAAGYPPQQQRPTAAGYPPQVSASGYPPQQPQSSVAAGYPPQQQRPTAAGYPPQTQQRPQAAGYPLQQQQSPAAGYPSQSQATGYPPQQSTYQTTYQTQPSATNQYNPYTFAQDQFQQPQQSTYQTTYYQQPETSKKLPPIPPPKQAKQPPPVPSKQPPQVPNKQPPPPVPNKSQFQPHQFSTTPHQSTYHTQPQPTPNQYSPSSTSATTGGDVVCGAENFYVNDFPLHFTLPEYDKDDIEKAFFKWSNSGIFASRKLNDALKQQPLVFDDIHMIPFLQVHLTFACDGCAGYYETPIDKTIHLWQTQGPYKHLLDNDYKLAVGKVYKYDKNDPNARTIQQWVNPSFLDKMTGLFKSNDLIAKDLPNLKFEDAKDPKSLYREFVTSQIKQLTREYNANLNNPQFSQQQSSRTTIRLNQEKSYVRRVYVPFAFTCYRYDGVLNYTLISAVNGEVIGQKKKSIFGYEWKSK